MTPVDLQFSTSDVIALNSIIALMMFGVALSMRPRDVLSLASAPKAPLLGLLAQVVILPAATSLGVWLLDLEPGLAIGAILLASCPSGTFSNALTWIARGNVGASVGMSALSSLSAPIVLPLNFALYGWLNPITRPILRQISLPFSDVALFVAVVLAVPMAAGMWTGARFPGFAARVDRPLRLATVVIMLGIAGLALLANLGLFVDHSLDFVAVVIGMNLMALLIGQGVGRLGGLTSADRRATTFEVGIQNSPLGLGLLFTVYPEAGAAILILAFWGVWHVSAGTALALWWARRDRRSAALCAQGDEGRAEPERAFSP